MIKSLSRGTLLSFPYHRSFWFSGRNIFPASQTSTTGVGRVFLGIRAMSASGSSSSSTVAESEVKVLNGIYDNYGGVVVTMNEPMDSQRFASMLKTSISHWRQQGKRGVWIKLPICLANLVEPAVKQGFWYHHAEPTYLMLVYWIPGGASTLPANASHRVCVGAFVMNEKREVLVVQENSGRFRGEGIWKFPTGVVEEGEDICAAAVREVKEEASIDTEFVEVLAFRQSHQSSFEKSNLFFLCMLRPLSFDIKKQETEIAAAKWMQLEEYMALPYVQKREALKCAANICAAKVDKGYQGFSPVLTKSIHSDDKENYFYLNTAGCQFGTGRDRNREKTQPETAAAPKYRIRREIKLCSPCKRGDSNLRPQSENRRDRNREKIQPETGRRKETNPHSEDRRDRNREKIQPETGRRKETKLCSLCMRRDSNPKSQSEDKRDRNREKTKRI